MKKILFSIAFTTVLASVYSFAPTTKTTTVATYTVATDASKVEFTGSKKAGYHHGSFTLKSGSIDVENGKLANGKFVIDLSTVKADAGEKLEGHLKSPDFFDVAKFAEATYEITNVNYTSASTAEINGTLSLKGISLPVKFIANIRNIDDKKFFAQANFSIDRTLWGINYGVGMVSNDVQVAVFLFANK
ncbi:MAG TPA: YceI family protein [Chitinophagaceae bacterium]|nr:YceI family protein [Chitinophagaceae bacterium]